MMLSVLYSKYVSKKLGIAGLNVKKIKNDVIIITLMQRESWVKFCII